MQETVDQDRAVRRDADGLLHIKAQSLVVIYDLHPPAAEHVRGTYHHRIPDAVRDSQSLLGVYSHAGLGHGNREFFHHLAETVAILGKINRLRRGSQDVDAAALEFGRQV